MPRLHDRPAVRGSTIDVASPVEPLPITVARTPAWVRLSPVAVALIAVVVAFWNLTVSGYANTYYSAAAQAAVQSWSAMFFGSIDAAGFITVDKPPVSLWAMGLSVRILGLSPFAVLLPQALASVAAAVLLWDAVRDLTEIVAEARKTVVTITADGVSTDRFSAFGRPTSGVGSGLILTSDGYILTNRHVVENRGLRPENMPHVFDRFWRAPAAPSGGTGLGLAIARWIAERHAGRIGVTNRDGGGAAFRVELPAAVDATATGTPAGAIDA